MDQRVILFFDCQLHVVRQLVQIINLSIQPAVHRKHAIIHIAGCVSLLMHRGYDVIRRGKHVLKTFANRFNCALQSTDGALNFFDLHCHIAGTAFGAFGQLKYLVGNHGEPFARLARAGGFDCRVNGQQLCFVCDFRIDRQE